MQSKADNPEAYIQEIDEARRERFAALRQTVLENIPEGYKEVMAYGMIAYVIPHGLYPKGYHVNPQVPLMLISLAAQKNHIALYHMGLYANSPLLEWFLGEYPKHSNKKLDMGKGCLRFKKAEDIPMALLVSWHKN